jgi:hypothetical protein
MGVVDRMVVVVLVVLTLNSVIVDICMVVVIYCDCNCSGGGEDTVINADVFSTPRMAKGIILDKTLVESNVYQGQTRMQEMLTELSISKCFHSHQLN